MARAPISTCSRSITSTFPPCRSRSIGSISRSLRPSVRSYASVHPSSFKWSSTTSQVLGGVAGVGLIVTSYGLFQYYLPTSIWPEQIRDPLRAAIKAKMRGDTDQAEVHYRKAIDAALSMPSTSLNPDPLLKVSGIYIALAALLEAAAQPVKAYEALRQAHGMFGSDPLAPEPNLRLAGEWAAGSRLSEADHVRAIRLSQKLGQLALQIATSPTIQRYPDTSPTEGPNTWSAAAEHYLSSALTAMLSLAMLRTNPNVKSGSPPRPIVVGRDLDLPESTFEDEDELIDLRGLGMTMESLAEVFALKGEYNIAGGLLIQAVSTLLPPKVSKITPSIADRCQAALLMTTVSSHALRSSSPRAVKNSRSWSLRSLQTADAALREAGEPNLLDPATMICGRAKSVASYNLGMLAEIESDPTEAKKYFKQGLENAKAAGFKQGQMEATDALRRLRSGQPMK